MAHGAAQLVGRHDELEVITHALEDLAQDRSGAVEVVGEPGIGKTRLLTELARRADALSHVVLSGSASELESDVPFSVFVDALDDFVRSLDPHRLEALSAPVLAELATVFPSLSHFAVGQELALQHERYRSHRAVRELLQLLSESQPLVLVLDDIHWADSGSVELLSALLRRPPSRPVLIALGVRPRQMPERLSIALARAVRAGTVVQIEPSPLTPTQAWTFLGDAAEAAERAGIYAESGGNPFYLEQLARALDRTAPGLERAAEITWSGARVPGSVVAALAEELALLSPAARRVLEGAAIAGDPFELELAAAAAAVGDGPALDAMNELLALDLVRITEVPRRFRFRHPLLRRAVYEGTPVGTRIAAHGRAAAALAAQGAPVSSRAHHVEYSAALGDLAAVAVLREAGVAAARRTPASAARWFAAALRLLGKAGAPADRLGLLAALAEAQAATGQFEDARTALLEAIAQLPPGALSERVGLTAACAGVEQLLGRHEDAHHRLVGALHDLDDAASAQAAALLISLAVGEFYQQKTAASRDWALRALDIARPLGERGLVACAAAAGALACAFEGATHQAERYRLEAAELIDTMPDSELALRLDAIAYLSGAEVYLDRFDACIGHGLRGLAVARSTDQNALVPMLSQALGTGLLAQGRLTEAAEVLDGSIEGARLVGNAQSLAWGLLNRGYVAALAGAMDAALTAAAESVELTREAERTLVSTYSGVVMALVQLELGQYERAATLFASSAGGETMPLIAGGWRANYLDLLARSHLMAGHAVEGARAAGHARSVAESTGLRTARGWAERAAAAVAIDAGDFQRGAAHAAESVVACEDVGMVLEAGLSRMTRGHALVELGDVDGAAAEFERALRAFDRQKAERSCLAAERELRRLGRVIHHRSKSGSGAGLSSLTARERQLADLVLDRRTNSEIAATLFLSPKTVEAHLRNIFHKMQVTSRLELARAVARSTDRPAD